MDGTPMTTDSPAASQATVDFASALSSTPEWQAWEDAALRLRSDASAQRSSAVYDERRRALRLKLMLQAVTAEEEAGLQRLHDALFAEPSVVAYAEAEAALKAMCGATAERLSRAIGLDYAGSCAPSCCG
jgi:cell fate (sporulation/competence/biofilm development) regulator YlbF (YheA/YmcA/DUF963 family)